MNLEPELVVLCPEEGLYGVDIPKNIWHNVECLELGSVFFECKEGPFVEHEKEGVLRLMVRGYWLEVRDF